jgi:hypothetical protein
MELDPFAQRLLEITREARTPSEGDKQRVERALAVSLGLATATAAGSASAAAVSGASAAPAASGSATGVAALKWLGVVAVAASALTAGYFAFAPADPAPILPKTPVQKTAPRAVEPPPAPVVERASPPEAPVAEPREPRRSASEKTKKPETLAEELDLLHDAQAKWRNRDAAGALELIAQHKKRYPKSALAPEREALRVFSLCSAGRVAEARAVARRSFSNAPRSPLRSAVEESCARP